MTEPLLLRPWTAADADLLVRHHQDPLLRRWLATHLDTRAEALAWIEAQCRAGVAGTRMAFAVCADPQVGPGEPLGHVTVKAAADPGRAQVGYWTAPQARGRGVAGRALDLATWWATGDGGPFAGRTLELVHAVGNDASCRVAEKHGYRFDQVLPAAPPARPRALHRHVRPRAD